MIVDEAALPRSMQDAMLALSKAGVDYELCTAFQIKVGDWNYYAAKGTIYRDGDAAPRPQRGITAFLKLLSKDPGSSSSKGYDLFL